MRVRETKAASARRGGAESSPPEPSAALEEGVYTEVIALSLLQA